MIPRVLSIAGTDPTGGAGIHADLKAIAANGGYGMAVVTALVAQNTQGVRHIHAPPVSFLRQQLEAVSDDVDIDAVKLGMLFSRDIIAEVDEWLKKNRPPFVVLDPVMVASSGDSLLDSASEDALRDLLSRVDLVTPNIPELGALLQVPPAREWSEALAQAHELSVQHSVTVLLKGGHLSGDDCYDALVDARGRLAGGKEIFEVVAPRVDTTSTHGTGCSFSSAMATHVVWEGTWERALEKSKTWLTDSLRDAHELSVGKGRGPINHFSSLWKAAGTGSMDTNADAQENTVTGRWWAEITQVLRSIEDCELVGALGDGTLDREAFSYYIAQDVLYLEEFSRLLTRASELAPTNEEREFWAACAEECVGDELTMHREELNRWESRPPKSVVNVAYLQHLNNCDESYPLLIAGLLPCFWIYDHVGKRLRTENYSGHPYEAWLGMYGSDEFAQSTLRARNFVEQAANTLSVAEERDELFAAFRMSSEHELAFFGMWHGTRDSLPGIAHKIA